MMVECELLAELKQPTPPTITFGKLYQRSVLIWSLTHIWHPKTLKHLFVLSADDLSQMWPHSNKAQPDITGANSFCILRQI